MSMFIAVIFFLIAAFFSIFTFVLPFPFLFIPLLFTAVLAGFGAFHWANAKKSNRDGKVPRGKRVVQSLGTFVSGLVLGLPFVVLWILSAFSGGGNIAFLALSVLAILGGVVGAIFGLLDFEGENQIESVPKCVSASSEYLPSAMQNNRPSVETRTGLLGSSVETTSEFPVESAPILEAADVRQFLISASHHRIRLTNSDQPSVTRFFNAVRYGQIELVRKLLSGNPLLVLTQDANGNTPIDVAAHEDYRELQDFFKSCLK